MNKSITFGLLCLAGCIAYHTITAPSKEECDQRIEADRQARAAYKAANPDFGPGGIKNRISRAIAEKGVLSGYVCPDTNIDTLTHPNAKRKHQPADQIGSRAGFTHVDFQDTLIGNKSKEKGVQITIPKRIPNRYKDSSGR